MFHSLVVACRQRGIWRFSLHSFDGAVCRVWTGEVATASEILVGDPDVVQFVAVLILMVSYEWSQVRLDTFIRLSITPVDSVPEIYITIWIR